MIALTLAAATTPATQEREPLAIVEIGGAGEWTLQGKGASYGPSVAVETTPIEDVLELEAGVAPLFSHGRTEWDVDFLFKKPFTLSSKAELMIGAGPTWSRAISHGRHDSTWGLETALDLMLWPSPRRRFGWYVEPSYTYGLSAGHEQGVSVSAGLLIPIR